MVNSNVHYCSDVYMYYTMENREEAINRMLRILNRFCQKLKFAMYLPVLVEEPRFKNIFEPHNINDFKKLYKLCTDEHLKDQYSSEGNMQVALIHEEQLQPALQWAVALESLFTYEYEIVLLLEDLKDDVSPAYINIINHSVLLKEIIEWQMKMTPKQLRQRKIDLRNAEAAIIRNQEEIKILENDFNEESLKHNDTVKKSQDEISYLNQIIDEVKRKHNEELDHEMNRYKTRMRGLTSDIIDEENNLNNQLKAYEVMLENLKQANSEQEKLLREQYLKTEKKFFTARNSYDRDLSKLHELRETLEMQLRVTSNHYEVLKNEYDVQSVLFTNLRKERELAMMQAFAEQLDNFEKNRAARIIQRTWRAYHERISTKKKKRTRRNK